MLFFLCSCSSGTFTEDSSDLCFGRTDTVEQTTMCRTSEDTTTAIDAVHDVMFLAVFPHLELAHSLEQIGFETHRASLNALTATDTVLFLRTD